MVIGNRLNEGRKYAKPKIVKQEKFEPRNLRQAHRCAEKMDQSASKDLEGGEKLQPDHSRMRRRSHERLIFDKMELARNYFWCDELDFYRMKPAIRELLAFANHDYSGENLADVLNFPQRVANAQRHASRYVYYRLILSLE